MWFCEFVKCDCTKKRAISNDQTIFEMCITIIIIIEIDIQNYEDLLSFHDFSQPGNYRFKIPW